MRNARSHGGRGATIKNGLRCNQGTVSLGTLPYMRARRGRRCLETFIYLAAGRRTLIGAVRVIYPGLFSGEASGFEFGLIVTLCVSKQRCWRHDCDEHEYCRGSYFHLNIPLYPSVRSIENMRCRHWTVGQRDNTDIKQIASSNWMMRLWIGRGWGSSRTSGS